MLKIGHRGAGALAPENTLVSFRQAIKTGVDLIELDIQLTKDNQLVVFHDANLERITGADLRIKDLTLAQLKQYDIGSWFAERFRGERIPTLQEVIQLVKGKVQLNIELKPGVDYPQLVIKKLLRLLIREDFKSEVLISSFNHRLLQKVKEFDATLQTAILVASLPVKPVKMIKWARADGIHSHYLAVTKELVTEVQRKGYFINTWTVNKRQVIKDLQHKEVDGIITDDPRLFK
ncbi:glycerophosphodiester phosphodiesterase [Halanaerobaculum tunisiense]